MTDPTDEKKPVDPLWLLAQWVSEAGPAGRLGNGEAAALRRLDPRSPDMRHLIAAHRVLAMVAAATGEEGMQGGLKDLILINAIALAGVRHSRAKGLGAALGEVNLSDLRLAQLLSADLATLADLIPRTARRLTQVGSVNWREVQQLLATADGASDDLRRRDIRVRITRDYQRKTNSIEKEPAQ